MYRLKVSILLIFLCGLLLAQGQVSVQLEKGYGNIPFKVFIEKLKTEKQVILLTKDEWIESLQTPPITGDSVKLEDLLNELFTNSGLSFVRYKGYYVITPQTIHHPDITSGNEKTVMVIGNPMNEGKFKTATITGHILDGKVLEPVPGAQVFCEEHQIATSTDADGKFRIELPAGKQQLRFSFMGLKDEVRTLLIYESGSIDVELFEKAIALKQVNVLADDPDKNYRSATMGMTKLNMKAITKLSVLMGEPDLIKSMVMLPGVQSIGENASGFNVRGGTSDQNLILIHNTTIFNTSHLFGLFSVFNPTIVRDVTLYKSSIPARFGGRASSVMDITLKKGQQEKLKFNGSIGLINGNITIEGPVTSKASFMIGARTTYSDWMLALTKNYQLKQSSARFYDLNAKIDYTVNAKNLLSIFGYLSNDYFMYSENAEYQYGNKIGTLKWDHSLNNQTTGTLSLSYSDYQSEIADLGLPYYTYLLSTAINQKQFSYHIISGAMARHKLNGGIGAINYFVQPGQSAPYNNESMAETVALLNENSYEYSAYLEDDFDLTPDLGVIAGIRYSGFLTLGYDSMNTYPDNQPLNPNTVSGTEIIGQGELASFHHGIEPRLALRYQFGNQSSLKMGYNRTIQYIRQLSNSASITPADYWKSSDRFIEPLISDQLAIGYFRNLDNNKYEISLEAYYKGFINVVDYKNGARLLLNQNVEQSIVSGVGRAFGVELLVKKNIGILTGWLAYTYSRSFKKMESRFEEEQINDGNWYNSEYDKPHDLTLFLNYKLSRRFTFSSTFIYSTGRPITYPEQRYLFAGHETIVYSDRNKYRLPDYHRLDISFTYEGSIKRNRKWRDSWTISVYNLYGRKNAFSVFYEKQKPTQYNDYRGYALYKFSAIGVPVPSFTYNFWF